MIMYDLARKPQLQTTKDNINYNSYRQIKPLSTSVTK